MTKARINYLWICALMILFNPGCEEPKGVIDKDITITEVKAHYDHLTSTNPLGRQATDSVAIDWETARYLETSQGDALTFSLASTTRRYVSHEENGVLYPVVATGYAIAYKAENDEMHLEYVQAVPTADTESCTGYLTIADWSKEAYYVFEFENGQALSGQENGRTEDCQEIFYFDCTRMYMWMANCTADIVSTVTVRSFATTSKHHHHLLLMNITSAVPIPQVSVCAVIRTWQKNIRFAVAVKTDGSGMPMAPAWIR